MNQQQSPSTEHQRSAAMRHAPWRLIRLGLLISLACMVLLLVPKLVKRQADRESPEAYSWVLQAQIEPALKVELWQRLNQVSEDYSAGRISSAQAEVVFNFVQTTRLVRAAEALCFTKQIQASQELTAAQKQLVLQTCQRLAYAIQHELLPDDVLTQHLQDLHRPQSVPSLGGRFPQRQQPPLDTELFRRASLLKASLDAAGIPEVEYRINLLDELNQVISSAYQPPEVSPPPITPELESSLEALIRGG